MAYENLKSAIKQVIKQNGNQEITGYILQNALLNVVDNIPEVVVLGENEYNSIDKDENKIYFVYEEEQV